MSSADRQPTWYTLAVSVPAAQEEEATALLLELFPQGLEVWGGSIAVPGGPDVIAPEARPGDAITLIGYSTRRPEGDLLSLIRSRLRPDNLAIGVVAETDFTRRFREHFRRIELHPGFGVVAARADQQPGDLVLTPGLVFGTGDHPSTRLALQGLIPVLRPGIRLADVGTGTGILALFARRQGADPVIAYDIDPEAVRAARRHARRNRLPIAVRTGTIRPSDGPFDVIVANIVAEVLVALREALSAALSPGGALVLSGILSERRAYVEKAFQSLLVEWQASLDGWIALRLRKPLSS